MWRGILLIATLATSWPACAQTALQSMRPAGATPALAQTLDWLDAQTFVVGRLDGSISLFRTPGATEAGPVITASVAAPSGRGVEMIARLDDGYFVASDGVQALTVWRRTADGGAALSGTVDYDAAHGAANSGTVVKTGDDTLFVSGHEDGYVLIWRWANGFLHFLKAVDDRSREPPANPYGIHNIRGLKPWRSDAVVTGSEDGDVVGLSLPAGTELFRTRFNAAAKRGINNVSILNDLLLVSNCAVGSSDKNIWLYDLRSGRPVLLDAENLEIDALRSQVFDFDAALMPASGGAIDFFATTEEGFLWQGRVDGGRLVMTGLAKISSDGGAAMAASPIAGLVATASGSLRLYKPD